MHGKDYWKLHYPQCIAWDVIMYILPRLSWCFYSVISVSYFNYLMMASETPRIYAMFWCKFTPGVEKMLPLIRKRRDPHKYMT